MTAAAQPDALRAPGPIEPAPAERALPVAELTVVVPTFNERDNVETLVARLAAVLEGVRWQAIFVDDDSPDHTAQAVKRMAVHDPRILCLRRVGRRGLSGAVMEGAMASAAAYVAVIDGDLQHDERLLPEMLGLLRADAADVVVGSRYLGGDRAGPGLSPPRRLASRLAGWLARRVAGARISDPVSGFFMIRRELIDAAAPRLSTHGFKILFDILATQKPVRVVELPYLFRARNGGQSKFDARVSLDYLALLVSKSTNDLVSVRALGFAAVGGSGLLVHLAVLKALLHLGFAPAQSAAALTAMTSNYLINNELTYRDRRKRGAALLTGYLRFAVLCSAGFGANVAVATAVHSRLALWWLAGASGAMVGAVWNYVTTSIAVW